MPLPIFKDPIQQELFDRQGFITLPFIDKDIVEKLDQVFDELHPQLPDGGFISGSYSPDYNYKKTASDNILQAFKKSYEKIFQNYHAIGGAFLFKMPSENSELMMHQDWTIVDEGKYYALNVWVPLTDINEKNGALMVLPGSHFRSIQTLRAPTLPFFFSGNENILKEHLVPLYVKAGEAVIINQSLVHFSPANISGKIRKAITAGVVSQGAQICYYYKDPNSEKKEIEKFEQEESFLIQFNDFFKDIFNRPTFGKYVESIPYNSPVLEKNELEKTVRQMLESAGYSIQKPGILKRLKSLFS
ncbi:MAG: phytanoyl-CoA dioxygenase family protein [Saprospiraceae bacterium]